MAIFPALQKLTHMWFNCYPGVTSVAAEVLGLADRIGSLRVGKEANLVLLER